jgi:diacylglycerol kinase family enzyme
MFLNLLVCFLFIFFQTDLYFNYNSSFRFLLCTTLRRMSEGTELASTPQPPCDEDAISPATVTVTTVSPSPRATADGDTAPAAFDPAALRAPLDPLFIKRDHSALVPAPCEGACVFNTYVIVFGLIGTVAAATLLGVHQTHHFVDDLSSSGGIAGTVVLAAVLGLSVLRICAALSPAIIGTLPCTAPAPPPRESVFTRPPLPPVSVRRAYVIVNTTSGTGLGARILSEVVTPAFAAAGAELTVLRTQYAGHARDYALMIPLVGYDALLVIGGDGSLLEAANGLLARADGTTLPVGLIPGGSGNAVATDLGTLSCAAAVARVFAGVTAEMDVNVVTDGAFMARHAARRRTAAAAATPAAAAGAGTAGAAAGAGAGARLFDLMLRLNPIARTDVAAADTAAAAASEPVSLFGLPPSIPGPGAGAGACGYAAGVACEDEAAPLGLYSCNEISLGLIGDVGATAEACRALGPARYDVCGLWGAMKLQKLDTEVAYVSAAATAATAASAAGGAEAGADVSADADAVSVVRSPMVTAFVNHTQHFGQGLRVAPYARLDDGLLDMTFACDATRGELLAIFAQLPIGAHLGNALVRQERVRACRLALPGRSGAGGVVNVDGEVFPYAGALYVAVAPRALRVFTEPGAVPSADAKKGVQLWS